MARTQHRVTELAHLVTKHDRQIGDLHLMIKALASSLHDHADKVQRRFVKVETDRAGKSDD